MKYKKKPIVIEAYQPYHGEMPEWFEDALYNKTICELVVSEHNSSGSFDIFTLEGTMHANPEDYIICGINGEIYPCKPDIFEKTYERVEEE